MKKIIMVLLAIAMFVISTVTPVIQMKVHADTATETAGFWEETYQAVIVAAMTVGAAGLHAQQTVEDNLTSLKDSASEAWVAMSPQLKDSFKSAVLSGGDSILVASEWLQGFFGVHTPKVDVDLTSGFTQYIEALPSQGVYGHTLFNPKSGYAFVINARNLQNFQFANGLSFSVEVGGYNPPTNYLYSSRLGNLGEISVADAFIRSSERDRLNVLLKDASFAQTLAIINQFGVAIGFKEISSNTVIDSSDVGLPPYNQVERFLNDRAANNNLSLGLPTSSPYTYDGLPLTPTATGLLLDGQPYTGSVDWRKETGLGLSDAGLVAIPDIMVNGVPHAWVRGSDGIPVPVNTVTGVPYTGSLDTPDVTTNPIGVPVWIDGIPFVRTPDGTLINQITGEIVPTIPDTPAPTPTEGSLGNFFGALWEWLKKILQAILAIPAAIVAALGALLTSLFVPSDDFWSNNFEDLKGIMESKLDTSSYMAVLDSFSRLTSPQFSDIVIPSIMGSGSVVVVESDYINSALTTIHKWVRGVIFVLLVFYNLNNVYKLIRGGDITSAEKARSEARAYAESKRSGKSGD